MSKQNIFAQDSVIGRSSAAIMCVRNSVIEGNVVAVAKLYSTRSAVIVAKRCYNLHNLAVQSLRLAASLVNVPNHATMIKWPITATVMTKLAPNVHFWCPSSACAAREPYIINLASFPMFAVALSVDGNFDAARTPVKNPVTVLEPAKTLTGRVLNHVASKRRSVAILAKNAVMALPCAKKPKHVKRSF